MGAQGVSSWAVDAGRFIDSGLDLGRDVDPGLPLN